MDDLVQHYRTIGVPDESPPHIEILLTQAVMNLAVDDCTHHPGLCVQLVEYGVEQGLVGLNRLGDQGTLPGDHSKGLAAEDVGLDRPPQQRGIDVTQRVSLGDSGRSLSESPPGVLVGAGGLGREERDGLPNPTVILWQRIEPGLDEVVGTSPATV